MIDRNKVINKIMGMPQEQVAKVLIFMAGMEAEHNIQEQNEVEQNCNEKDSTDGSLFIFEHRSGI